MVEMLVGRQKKKKQTTLWLVGFGMLLNEDWVALNF